MLTRGSSTCNSLDDLRANGRIVLGFVGDTRGEALRPQAELAKRGVRVGLADGACHAASIDRTANGCAAQQVRWVLFKRVGPLSLVGDDLREERRPAQRRIDGCHRRRRPVEISDHCMQQARALFGREVLDEDSDEILDADLSAHGYQLWTAAAGTIIEAQKRDLPRAVLVVHQFRPRDLDAAAGTGDTRDWATALSQNTDAFALFAQALEASGATSLKTDFIEAGTKIDVLKVESYVDV